MTEPEALDEATLEDRRWHALSPEEVTELLRSDPDSGLAAEEVERRRELFGPNKLPDRRKTTVSRVFARQFKDPLIYILLVAGAASLAIAQFDDAGFIFVVLLLNATLGTYQEYRAETAAESLQEMIEIVTRVRRAGEVEEVDSEAVVPGDIVLVGAGDSVPADLRLLEGQDLRVDESLLTGESTPVDKQADAELDEQTSLGDRSTVLHAGSTVMNGRGTAIACATGEQTALGKIAESLAEDRQAPPLVIRMRKFTRVIAVAILLVILILAGVQFARGAALLDIFGLAVALAVSAVPAGLPIAVTVALSRASIRMAERKVIVRKLPAIEGLGACTLIASDKTGTLTANQLTVQRIQLIEGDQPAKEFAVEGAGYDLEGRVTRDGEPIDLEEQPRLRRLVTAGALCNEAQLEVDDDELGEHSGDTVDLALLVLARKLGLSREALLEDHPELSQIPFESERRFAASFHRDGERVLVHVKGAGETLLEMCEGVDRERVEELEEQLAAEGYRVLALASGEIDEQRASEADAEQLAGLEFLGLVGLIDPIREGVLEAVGKCHRAGIEVRMITGDHPATALAIGRELQIAESREQVLTGREIEEGAEDISEARIYARVEPRQKTDIVHTLQDAGHFVAVTGDGVNDAPALHAAHAGVAMGESGTDVARNAADLILKDDNFASIVNGVEEGRIAYDNVRKVIWLLVSTAVAELTLYILAVAFDTALPLTPVQVLWLNVVTNGIQDVALAFEQGEPGVLDRRPRAPDERIFNRAMAEQVALSGLFMGGVAFAAFYVLAESWGYSTFEARNHLLLLMVLFENVHTFNVRSETRSVFRVPLSANKFLVLAVLLAQGLHVASMFIPYWGPQLLEVEPVSPASWGIWLAIALGLLVVSELYKLLRARPRLERERRESS
ncbi:MAG: cation-transporting P-type ATPase [Enhygromyxa sp.]